MLFVKPNQKFFCREDGFVYTYASIADMRPLAESLFSFLESLQAIQPALESGHELGSA